MAEPLSLRSLEESLEFAKKAYVAAAKVAGEHGQAMPMSLDAWLNQARERHKVLSHMNDEQLEVALDEERQEHLPALLATRDLLNNFLAVLDPEQGGTKAKAKRFAAGIVKRAKAAAKKAKKMARKANE